MFILDLGLSVASSPPSPVLPRLRAPDAALRTPGSSSLALALSRLEITPESSSASPTEGPTTSLAHEAREGLILPPSQERVSPPRWQQQAVECLACGDGLAQRVAALRLQNACHAALVQQGFLEWEPPAAEVPPPCGSSLSTGALILDRYKPIEFSQRIWGRPPRTVSLNSLYGARGNILSCGDTSVNHGHRLQATGPYTPRST